MQVSPVAPPVAAAVAGHAGLLLLPELLNITRLTPQAQALRQQRQADRDDDRRCRDEAAAQQLAAAAGADIRPTALELAAQAEREMAPGSRAARRQMATQEQQKAALQGDAFQRTLADAAARENPSTSRLNETAAHRTYDTRCESDESTPPEAATPAKSTRLPATQPGQVAAPPAAPPAENSPTAVLPSTPDLRQVAAASAPPTVVANAAAPSAALAQAVEGLSPITAARSAAGTSDIPQPAAPPTQTTTGAVNASGTQSNVGRTATSFRPQAAPLETGRTDANFERILRVLRAQMSQNRSHTTLQLDPPELGKIRLHLDLRADALALRVEPQTHLAYRLLSEHVDSLRDGLHATGVHLEHVEIRPPEANAAPEGLNLPPHSGGGNAGGGAEAETDHPQHSGTDSPAAGPSQSAAREASLEPSAEPRVNVWA
jgi:flagellar hook-length control protein FliK